MSLGSNGHGPQIAVSNGLVAFVATDPNGHPGLYEVSETGGPITKIVAAGDTIGQGVVSNVDMGAEPFSQGKLVFNVAFSCTIFSCPLGFGYSIYEANLVSTRTLNLPGGTIATPKLLPVGNQQIGQILAQLGATEPSNIYEYKWSGGWFTSDAFVAGAQPSDSFLFDLFNLKGKLLDQVILNSADSFQGTIAMELAPGDYLIGLACNGSCSDPNGTINFDTPVDGVAVVRMVPEPATWTMLLLGVGMIGFAARRRSRGLAAAA